MPEEKLEETLETTPEGKELKIETPEPIADKGQDLEKLNKQLYMRAKKAEERAKELETALKAPRPSLDSVDAILEVQQATMGLDATEIAELKLRASATGKSLTEARTDENYALWQEARREKVAKQKALEPSSRQDAQEDKNAPPGPNASLKELEEYYTNVVPMVRKHGNPPPPAYSPRV